MKKRFIRRIPTSSGFDTDRCVNELSNAGYEVAANNAIKFSELHSDSIYYGRRGLRLVVPFLKGHLKFNSDKQEIYWIVSINELLGKSFIVFLVTFVFFGLFFDASYLNIFIFSVVLGSIIFGINWVSLLSKIDQLTDKIINK